MTVEQLAAMLQETGIPFAYDHFAEGESPEPPFICYLLLTEITRTSAISMVSVSNLHLLPVSWSIICMQTAKRFMPGQSMTVKTWSACSASVSTA